MTDKQDNDPRLISLNPFLYIFTEGCEEVLKRHKKLCVFDYEEVVLEPQEAPQWHLYHYFYGMPTLCNKCSSKESYISVEYKENSSTYSIYFSPSDDPFKWVEGWAEQGMFVKNNWILWIKPPDLLVSKKHADNHESSMKILMEPAD